MTEIEVMILPRPQRSRRICGMPAHRRFSPEGGQCSDPVILTLDEYESIRLMDREGLTHEQCAEVMGVSRTTVTEIYAAARRKLAESIVEGRALEIEGGSVQLCDHSAEHRCELCAALSTSHETKAHPCD